MGVNSLPFGAVGSVAAFLRISLSLWLIGTKLFKIFWTTFFDDYGVTTRDELVDNTAACVGLLFELLGVDYAKEGKKAPPFSREFKLLGVRVDLHGAPKGDVKIGKHTRTSAKSCCISSRTSFVTTSLISRLQRG